MSSAEAFPTAEESRSEAKREPDMIEYLRCRLSLAKEIGENSFSVYLKTYDGIPPPKFDLDRMVGFLRGKGYKVSLRTNTRNPER